MQHIKDILQSEVDKRKEEIIKLASELVKIPSVNPPGDMHEISNFIVEHLKEHGIKYESFEPEKGKISIIASFGNKDGKTLAFNGHMDVVPVGEENRWSFPPFSGEIKNGFLLGRGSSDMKGGIAAQLASLAILADLDVKLNGKVLLMLVPDEETGGLLGTKWLLDNNKVVADACITGEPSGPEVVDIGEKGFLWFKALVLGEPGHGSLAPFVGDNAILKAYKVIEQIMKLREIDVDQPEDIKPVIDSSARMVDTILKKDGVGIVLKKPTVNVGVIHGGVKSNVVPDKCEISLDIRLPIGLSSEEGIQRLKNLIKEFEKDIDIIELVAHSPNYTSPSSEIVKIVFNNAKSVLGHEPKLFVDYATSDARHLRDKGIPSLHYGPTVFNAHGYNEKVKVDDIITVSKVYLGVIMDFLGTTK